MSNYPCKTCNASPCCGHAVYKSTCAMMAAGFPCMTCNSDPCCCNAVYKAAFPCMTCNSDPCCCHAQDDGSNDNCCTCCGTRTYGYGKGCRAGYVLVMPVMRKNEEMGVLF